MKRIVEVSSPGTFLHLENNSLTISRGQEVVGRVPLEDLGTLILASPALTVTSAVLGRLASHGGITVVVGADRQPEGALLPLRAHTTRGERIRAQVAATRPTEKRLWASLVIAKIRNQAALLADVPGRRQLTRLAVGVRSGDAGNNEAQAARIYWPLVFSECGQAFQASPFRRNPAGEWPNNLLNYGYAVLRAMTARAICGAGLLPEVGIQHHSRYDSFALASDLMEPFRPWVDHRCRELIPEGPGDLDRTAKEGLLGIYDDPVQVNGETTPLFRALERTAASLASSFLEAKNGANATEAAKRLVLPRFAECREG